MEPTNSHSRKSPKRSRNGNTSWLAGDHRSFDSAEEVASGALGSLRDAPGAPPDPSGDNRSHPQDDKQWRSSLRMTSSWGQARSSGPCPFPGAVSSLPLRFVIPSRQAARTLLLKSRSLAALGMTTLDERVQQPRDCANHSPRCSAMPSHLLQPSPLLRAPTGAAAAHTAIARPVAGHDGAAVAACWGVA